MAAKKPHIVIDARIRQDSTGRPVVRLLEHLQDSSKANRYTVILQFGDDWKPKKINFSVVYTNTPNFSFNLVRQITYSWMLYRLKADLVYFMLTPQQPLLYFGKQATFTHDLGMLKFARAGKLPGWLHTVRMRGYRLLLWSAHKRAEHIIVPTQFVADEVNKYHLFTNRKTTVAHEASEPPLKAKARAPEREPVEFIMYTGSAFEHKNLKRLIQAFAVLKEKHSTLELVLVGKREKYSKALEKWASSQPFFDDIHFTGFIPDEELKWYYQNARCYVFPTLNEGFGLPGLEAMVHGCPVASSNASCLPEVHGDAASYFDPLDVADIADKIHGVISSEKLREELITLGYKNAKRFSWKKFTAIHIDMFRSLVDSRD